MESEAQSAPESTEVAQHEPAPVVEQVEQVPESYNIFSEEQGPSLVEGDRAEPAAEQKKSKQFLENLKRDKQLRHQQIEVKQRQEAIAQKEHQLRSLIDGSNKFKENPEEYMRAQGLDPMKVYKEWTERILNTDGKPSVETQLEKNQRELLELKNKIQGKEQQEQQARHQASKTQAFNGLCRDVEDYATKNDGYETIKDSCTARDIVSGMVQHYQKTGEELTIEEAFEKIETGLRQREESFYKDPKILAKLQRYNPEASRTARGPQATLSARFKEQPTRTDPNDMPYEEIRDYWKGKLFT